VNKESDVGEQPKNGLIIKENFRRCFEAPFKIPHLKNQSDAKFEALQKQIEEGACDEHKRQWIRKAADKEMKTL
jgi:hypothetical protein